MAESEGISIEDFRVLTEQAGMGLSDAELEKLKPMYELYLGPVSRMNALELDAEDLALIFSPGWDPQV
jgi:hypothetical protein